MQVGRGYWLSEVLREQDLVDECVSRSSVKVICVTVTVTVSIDKLDLLGCTKWTKVEQKTVLVG